MKRLNWVCQSVNFYRISGGIKADSRWKGRGSSIGGFRRGISLVYYKRGAIAVDSDDIRRADKIPDVLGASELYICI